MRSGSSSNSHPYEERPSVYITGLERSGKTTLAAFLDAHPRIAVPDVGTNMWLYFAHRFRSLDEPENLRRCLDAMMSYDRIRFLQPDRRWIEKEFSRGPSTYGYLFSLFLIQFADRRGKQIWGAQSAWLDRFAPELLGQHPNTRIIHVLRDPRDRYVEVKAHWPRGRGQAGAAAAKWNSAASHIRTHLRRFPNRYMVVRFEDLVKDTSGELERVTDFLEVDFDAEMLLAEKKNLREAQDGVVKPHLAASLSKDFLGSFRTALTPEEITFLQALTARGRRWHDYPSVAIGMSATERLSCWAGYFPQQALRSVAWRAWEMRARVAPSRYGPQIDPRYTVENA